jgi:hypothetical protein
MRWTLLRTKETPLKTRWQANEIVVTQGSALIDRLRASEIERVTLVHAGEGESPGEVRAAIFELGGRTVVLGAESGIAGRVLFERQAYWSQRSCIYWVNQRQVSWPLMAGASRWPLRRRVPQHQSNTPDSAASLFDRSDVTGPHTWDQRKWHRIERRRHFPGSVIGSAQPHSGALA